MIDLSNGPTFFLFVCAAIMAVTGFFFFGREMVARGRQLDREREKLEKEIERRRQRGGL